MKGGLGDTGFRAVLFTREPKAVGVCAAVLEARRHRVELRRLGAAGGELSSGELEMVFVDFTAEPDAAGALLRKLGERSDREGFFVVAICEPAQRLACVAAGADCFLEAGATAEEADAWIALYERRLVAMREERRERNALEEANANLNAVVENTDDFVLFSDRNGSPIYFNSAYAEVMKQFLDLDMKPGIKPHELLPDAEQRAAWDDYHRRVLAGERFRTEYEHVLPDGTLRVFEVSYNPVRKDGEIIGFSEFSHDVTERRLAREERGRAREDLEREVARRTSELEESNRALREEVEHRRQTEEALRQSEQMYRSVYDTAPLAFVMWDRDCKVLAWNRQAEETFGWTAEEALGENFFDLIIPASERSRVGEVVAALLEGSRPSHVINENLTKSGETIVCEWKNAPLVDRDGHATGVLSLGLDVTERRAMERRLHRAQRLESIGQLAGGIAHDFNNQLVGILAYAELIERASKDRKVTSFAQGIRESARRSADLVEKLLAFARKAKALSEPVDLRRVASEVATLTRQRRDSKIEIVEKVEERPATVLGDPTLLHNALLNLAFNAREAMPDGGELTLSVSTVELTEEECAQHSAGLSPGDYVRVSVRDTGVGMDEATKARVFEPFFTTKPNGTGMGLAAAYGAIRSHGGAMQLSSELGRGTEFVFHIPFVPYTEEAQPARLRAEASGDTGRARLMIVDDEELVRESLAAILGSLGHEVCSFETGEQAIVHYSEHWREIDLVILDMVMPGIDGLTTLTQLRKINPRVRALLSSGYTIGGRVDDLLRAGLSGFLQKPYTVEAVDEKVSAALER